MTNESNCITNEWHSRQKEIWKKRPDLTNFGKELGTVRIRKGGKNTQKNCTRKYLHNPDNHDGVINDLEPDIRECEVKWALESITTNKASGGDRIPVELFQILKAADPAAVKVLHSICQQIWKTQQWPQDWKRSLFIPIPKKGNAKECSTTAQLHSSHTLVK